MTREELYRRGKEALSAAGTAEAELNARLLLEYVCGISRSDLLSHGEICAEPEEEEKYEKLIGRRKEGVPLQYLTGVQEFMGLEFNVSRHVLIPRQDTEILVEEALRNLHDGMRILDMCTGSGCILISLLHYSNDCEGVGADCSPEALAVAEENARKLLGSRVAFEPAEAFRAVPQEGAQTDERRGKLSFVQSDLFENVTGKFDVIVSNPPYIRSDVIGTLMPEVREHEPLQALNGGEDGLSFYRRIVEEGREHLFGGGMLLFEIGYDQAEEVVKLMEGAGFSEIRTVKDYAGLDRVVYGTRNFD